MYLQLCLFVFKKNKSMIILCIGTVIFLSAPLTSVVWPVQLEEKVQRRSVTALCVSLSLQKQGQLCHCQILSRAAQCKQQMVELVPERHVKSNHSTFSSAVAVWGAVCEITSASQWAQVFFMSSQFYGLVYGLWFVFDLWALPTFNMTCNKSEIPSNTIFNKDNLCL